MNTRKHRWLRVISSNIPCHGLIHPAGQRTSEVRTTCEWAYMQPHSSLASPLVPHHDIRCSGWVPEVYALCTTVRSRASCSAWWYPGTMVQRLVDTPNPGECYHRLAVKNWPPNPAVLMSPMCSCYSSPISFVPLNWEVFHTRQGLLPPDSPCLAGWAAIATGHAGAASGFFMFQQWRAHCDTITKSFLIGQTV
jgi:hypothetical protein